MKTLKQFTELIRNKREFLLILLLLTLSEIQLWYGDMSANTRQGMLVWEALFSGRFFQYYSVSSVAYAAGRMEFFSNYEMLVNLLVGIWELPLYIAERLMHCDDILSVSMAARVYAQLYLVIFTLLAGRALSRLGTELGLEETDSRRLFYLFCSSVFVLNSAQSVGQVDVIGIFFLLTALRHMLRGETKRYLLFLVFAADFKFFAIFFILPVILYRRKNLLQIATEALVPVIGVFLISLPFRLADPAGFAEKSVRMGGMLDDMLYTKLSFLKQEIPLFFLLYAAVCIAAYLKEPDKDKKTQDRACMHWILLSVICLFLTVNADKSYWYIYFTPYVLLLLMTHKGARSRELFAETVVTLVFGAWNVVWNYTNFNDIEGMPLKTWFHRSAYLHLNDLHDKLLSLPYAQLYGAIWALFVAWILVFAFRHRAGNDHAAKTDAGERFIPLLMQLRGIAGFLITNMAAVLYFLGKW
ncbi:MAG: hypothetical protein K6E50_09775 [Lachnospiraceae bacterium]|nr:hypothetical protein [Lachnospiraceae bacterium]